MGQSSDWSSDDINPLVHLCTDEAVPSSEWCTDDEVPLVTFKRYKQNNCCHSYLSNLVVLPLKRIWFYFRPKTTNWWQNRNIHKLVQRQCRRVRWQTWQHDWRQGSWTAQAKARSTPDNFVNNTEQRNAMWRFAHRTKQQVKKLFLVVSFVCQRKSYFRFWNSDYLNCFCCFYFCPKTTNGWHT